MGREVPVKAPLFLFFNIEMCQKTDNMADGTLWHRYCNGLCETKCKRRLFDLKGKHKN